MTVQYLDLLRAIRERGVSKGDRTGTGTISLFGYQMRFDLREGFPLLTTKKLPLRWIFEELRWMLSGSTSEPELRHQGVDIWKEWATREQCARFGRGEGDLGPAYGHQWRNFGASPRFINRVGGKEYGHDYRRDGFDQVAQVVEQLCNYPDSRRIILSGWHPVEATQVALPPCHTLTQFYVADGQLSAQMYQRSADVFLGVPFNIASYALLTQMLAHACDLKVGEFIHTFGDVHIYLNHQEQVDEQLTRTPKPLPTVTIRHEPTGEPLRDLLGIEWGHIQLAGYRPDPSIKAPVAV